MKIKNLLFALAVLSVLNSCEKDEDNNPTTSNDSYRIKQIFNNYYDGDVSKTVFSYEDEKLVKSTSYETNENGQWVEYSKTEITYSGDNASIIWYDKDSDNWEIDSKSEYIIQDGLIMEESSYNYDYEDGTWEEEWKWTYQYSGNNIIAWQGYESDNPDSEFEQNIKGEYTYIDGKLTEYQGFELDESYNWHLEKKKEYSYDGSNLDSWIYYELVGPDSLVKEKKAEFFYSGDNVSQIDYYGYSGLNQWISAGAESYKHNNNGYLIEELDEEGDKMIFEYEEGQGNAKLFFYYPEDLTDGKPAFKSAGLNGSRKYIPYYQRLKNR